eukprot:gene32456-40057_t
MALKFWALLPPHGSPFLTSSLTTLLELARVLKPNGTFLVTCNHPSDDDRNKTSEFKDQETIHTPIYGGEVIITHPSHTMSDYFSPQFFQLFRLDAVREFHPYDEQKRQLKLPTAFAFSATKL